MGEAVSKVPGVPNTTLQPIVETTPVVTVARAMQCYAACDPWQAAAWDAAGESASSAMTARTCVKARAEL